MTENYIEIRIYLKDDVDKELLPEVAEELQDEIADMVSFGQDFFTQDVTYEVKIK